MRLAAAFVSCLALIAASATQAAPPRQTALHVGDSLAFGTSLYLRQYLKGWRIQDDVDVSMQSNSVPKEVAAYGAALPRVLIVSAGTNGHPAATAQFRADVRQVLALAGPRRCVIWANIVRPPYQGVSYTRLNRALALLDRTHANLVVFDWAKMVAHHPGALSSDGVHVDVPFYRVRAQALAALAKRCR